MTTTKTTETQMMKFTKTIYAAVLLAAIAWAGVAQADSEGVAPEGSYRGGGYRVIVNSRQYVGFDPQGRKLVIQGTPTYGNQTEEWTSNGYTYRLTGLGTLNNPSESYQRVLLTIINPQGRTILNQRMSLTR